MLYVHTSSNTTSTTVRCGSCDLKCVPGCVNCSEGSFACLTAGFACLLVIHNASVAYFLGPGKTLGLALQATVLCTFGKFAVVFITTLPKKVRDQMTELARKQSWLAGRPARTPNQRILACMHAIAWHTPEQSNTSTLACMCARA